MQIYCRTQRLKCASKAVVAVEHFVTQLVFATREETSHVRVTDRYKSRKTKLCKNSAVFCCREYARALGMTMTPVLNLQFESLAQRRGRVTKCVMHCTV